MVFFYGKYFFLIAEYICYKCKRKFTKEQYELMNEYIKNKSRLSDCYYGDKNALPESQFQVLCKPSLWCRIEIH